MGMSDEQFEVYNALLNFIDELIYKETDEKRKRKVKKSVKEIFLQIIKK